MENTPLGQIHGEIPWKGSHLRPHKKMAMQISNHLFGRVGSASNLDVKKKIERLEILANTMDEFLACSGLEIKKDKSNIFAGGKLPSRDLEEIKTIFGFPLGTLPVRYLGVPLESKKLHIMHYSPLIEKIASLTKKWTG